MTDLRWLHSAAAVFAVALTAACGSASTPAATSTATSAAGAPPASQAVGPQYDTVHVYVDAAQFDTFVNSWLATFGGTANPQGLADVTPTASQTKTQVILSPVGSISVFGFTTPIPYPFGSERTGWLTTDLDAGVKAARDAGAALIVAPFPDPIGRDAVLQFPGGVNAQLYWHTTTPHYPALATVPDNHVYLSPDSVDAFLRSYLDFTQGKVDSDTAAADGALIGKPGTTFRQIHLTSPYGNARIAVTDGQLPYPYGRELAGYQVSDVAATIAKATAAGAQVLVPAAKLGSTTSAMLQWPGGYVAEVHAG
mgnify:CR=1 FL=1